MYSLNNVFNAGELSPKMRCRIDIAQYAHGFRYSKNFFITPYGTLERRPGTIFLTKAYIPSGKIRLIPFKVSRNECYIAEFGNNYIRMMRGGAVVCLIQNSGYSSNEIAAIDYCQSNDVMFLAHPDHPVKELRRLSEVSFQLREMPIAYPAMLDVNTNEAVTITPSAVSGTISLVANAAIFQAGHVGAYFQLQQQRPGTEIDHTQTESISLWTSSSVEIRGYWSFVTHGTWKGKVYLDRSEDGGNTWETYRTFSSEEDNNVESSGTEDDDNIFFRIRIVDYVQTTQEAYNKHVRVILNNTNTIIYGAVQITAVADAMHATANVVRKLGSAAATSYWCEGAWSLVQGFPSSICFFEERLCLGATYRKPNTIWTSKTNNWNNFEIGQTDDDALMMTLSSNTTNEIMWMTSQSVLLVGTNDSEWIISGGNYGDSPLTPSSISARPQSAYGSADVNGRLCGDAVLFVQTRGRKVREMVYSRDRQGFIAPDRTILAEHITRSGIVDTCLQQQPDTMLWCLLQGGTLAVLTYERDQEVFGWQRIEFPDGKVESLCTLPVSGSDGDTVILAIRRGNEVFIEELDDREYGELENACFSDSSVKFDGGTSAISTLTGLEHLNGKCCAILADGAPIPNVTISGGTLSLERPATKICVGIPFESIVELNPIESEAQNGTTLLRKKQVNELRVMLYRSVGGEVRAGNDVWQTIVCRDVLSDPMDIAISDKEITVAELPVLGGYDEHTSIFLRQCDPLPFNIAAVVSEMRLVE